MTPFFNVVKNLVQNLIFFVRRASYHFKAYECKNVRAFNFFPFLNKSMFNITLKIWLFYWYWLEMFKNLKKNSNPLRFLISYVLKWYEARRLKKWFRGLNEKNGVKFLEKIPQKMSKFPKTNFYLLPTNWRVAECSSPKFMKFLKQRKSQKNIIFSWPDGAMNKLVCFFIVF